MNSGAFKARHNAPHPSSPCSWTLAPGTDSFKPGMTLALPTAHRCSVPLLCIQAQPTMSSSTPGPEVRGAQVCLTVQRKVTRSRPLVARWGIRSEKSARKAPFWSGSWGAESAGSTLPRPAGLRAVNDFVRAARFQSRRGSLPFSTKSKGKLPFLQVASSESFLGVSLSNGSFLACLSIAHIKTYYILRNPPSPQRSLSTGSI